MIFASWTFVLVFLPLTLLLFRCAGEWRRGFLIVASFAFYAWAGPWNALVLAASIAANAGFGRLLTKEVTDPARRKRIFWCAIAANVGLLAAFKVAALDLSETSGFTASERILIPLALSFVTFQQIGFVTACYKRQIAAFALRDYLFFIAFFPQLVMGPIVRFQDMAAQLQRRALHNVTASDLATGLAIFTFGLAQKVLLADQIAVPVDAVFVTAQTQPVTSIEAWFAIVGFQLQIYFDFAGYADMAIGLARMFGIDLPINFDRPLFARDRFDVWRRWHISFASFMRAHVFTPLMRRWRWPAAAALAATGLLSGLWHGLGVTFVLWGFVQTAILLYAHRRRQRTRNAPASRVTAFRMVVATFMTTCLIGALFRAPTLAAAGNIYGALGGIGAATDGASLLGGRAWVMLPLCIAVGWGLPNSAQWFRPCWRAIDPRPSPSAPPVHPLERLFGFRLSRTWAATIALMLTLSLASLGEARRFIYVQF